MRLMTDREDEKRQEEKTANVTHEMSDDTVPAHVFGKTEGEKEVGLAIAATVTVIRIGQGEARMRELHASGTGV